MKLLTHNMLTSHVRGVRPGGGFPLRIQATEVKVNNVDFNQEFVARMIPKVEWGALVEAAESLPPEYENNEDFLRKVHHVLLELNIGLPHLAPYSLSSYLDCSST
uniref:tRNA methyltransferase activator subunit 11-2 n=1 Tax=Gopherus evgoodei TaxID=1825980 RepID=A0A8C5EX28_9SAUR